MKKILILKATKDICGNEVGLLEHNFKLLEMEVVKEEIHSEIQLTEIVKKYNSDSGEFDYIYLCTHGNKEGFLANMGGEENIIKWHRFSQIICENGVLKPDTILLLACCKGGMFQVATDILVVCNKINYVCGVKWNVAPWDLTTGFVVFVHNIENKKAQPSYAAEKASLATDYTFVCYDRDEVEVSPSYESRRFHVLYEIGWVDENGDWIEADEKIKENVGIID